MLNKKRLRTVKNASVAIGLINKRADRRPVFIAGSGFFVSSRGYVVTAKHVLDGCDEVIAASDKQVEELEIAVLSVATHGSSAEVRVMREVNTYAVRVISSASYVGPLDPDIGVIIPGEGVDDIGGTPFLNIKQSPATLDLYQNAIICGYPSGDQSLDMFRRHIGLRLSPIIQFGRITGFMPTDDVKVPWGIQTDIIGTGGSSGSAIVDPTDGNVVGIAQNVFVGEVQGYTKQLHASDKSLVSEKVPITGWAKVGLVYGISFHQFHHILNRIEDEIISKSNHKA
jgi:hypothetical protein